MIIYRYWEGKLPDYIEMCRRTLHRHTHGDNQVGEISDTTVHPELPINLKVDYFKATYIYEHGGFWIDADMIVMKDLSPIFDLLADYEFVGIPGFFGAKQGAPILKRWIDGMDAAILRGGLTFSDLIQPLLHDSEFKEFEPLTREMICPIYHTESNKFFELAKQDIADSYIVTLYNSQFPDWFKQMGKEQILNSNMVISQYFKKALE